MQIKGRKTVYLWTFDFFEIFSKKGLTIINRECIIHIVASLKREQQNLIGVWLSLARVLDLGSRGRRFESCHPDVI